MFFLPAFKLLSLILSNLVINVLWCSFHVSSAWSLLGCLDLYSHAPHNVSVNGGPIKL